MAAARPRPDPLSHWLSRCAGREGLWTGVGIMQHCSGRGGGELLPFPEQHALAALGVCARLRSSRSPRIPGGMAATALGLAAPERGSVLPVDGQRAGRSRWTGGEQVGSLAWLPDGAGVLLPLRMCCFRIHLKVQAEQAFSVQFYRCTCAWDAFRPPPESPMGLPTTAFRCRILSAGVVLHRTREPWLSPRWEAEQLTSGFYACARDLMTCTHSVPGGP